LKFLGIIADLFVGWARLIAGLAVERLDRWILPRSIRMDEQTDGSFAFHGDRGAEAGETVLKFTAGRLDAGPVGNLLRGSRVEIRLLPSRFLFRTLELPAQAAEFLQGIVGAQIDRLTPWTASSAAFGCSAPLALDAGRISTVIAVVPRPVALGYVQATLPFQPASVVVSTAEENGAGTIEVYDQKADRFLSVPRLGRALVTLLASLAVVALLSLVAEQVLTSRIEGQKTEVLQETAKIQALTRAGTATPDQAALRQLERKKHETPAASIVLEALSQSLPDNTYLTELHFTGNKVQLVGISNDAPSLIRLLEQAPNFNRATFYAPTTRSPSDPGERFHIEARVEPLNKLN
jgi:general secretion pathway protein L